MESLTDRAFAYEFVPPVVEEYFFRGGHRRARCAPLDAGVTADADGANAGEEAPEEDAATRAAIRRLNRAIMASWRDDGDGAYEPDVKDEWTRVKYEFGEACEADDGGEEEDPESETARERRCANRLMDMVEKDVHACVPALEMMQRMDQNIDAFEAFVDDMERRFALGTLPKRDVLGDKYLFRWRFFVLSVFVLCIAIAVGVARSLARLIFG